MENLDAVENTKGTTPSFTQVTTIKIPAAAKRPGTNNTSQLFTSYECQDAGPTLPPLPMPPVQGEVTPSPPPSPSPAPGRQYKPGETRINQLLDAAMAAPPRQTTTDTPDTVTLSAKSGVNQNRGTKRSADQDPEPASDQQFPQLDQVTEAASLRAQARPRRIQTRDPIDKYTWGVTTLIHDTFPDAVYEFMAPQTIEEWGELPGEKLLAIPFGSDARNPNLQEEVCNQIFTAAAKITQSCNLGVATPQPNEEGTR